MSDEVMKRCSHCKEIKPVSEYGKNKSTNDGYHYYCKTCQNSIMSMYFKTEKGKQLLNRSIKKYHQSDKGKVALKRAIAKATDAGYYRYGKGAISILKLGAKKRDISFKITEQELEQWWTSTDDKCYYCKSTLEEFISLRNFILDYDGDNYEIKKFKRVFASNKQAKIRWMTIDRLNNSIGYELDNIRKSCWFCNYLKGSCLSSEDMVLIANRIISRLKDEILKETKHHLTSGYAQRKWVYKNV